MTLPTNGSPTPNQDELEAMLIELQKNTDAWWNTPQPEYQGKHPAELRAETLASLRSYIDRTVAERLLAELEQVKANTYGRSTMYIDGRIEALRTAAQQQKEGLKR